MEEMHGKNYIKPGWLIIVILFLENLPGLYQIYLSKQEMDYLMHFLDPQCLFGTQYTYGSIS